MINEVIIMGRIATDLEPILINDNMLLKFNLALNRDKDNAEFFPVECWNKIALNVLDFAQKGTQILVKGHLKQDRFTAKDERKRSVIKIKAQYITVLSSKPKEVADEIMDSTNN